MDSLTRRLSALDRQRSALELRKAGATFEAIARQLGYASGSGAQKAVRAALKITLRAPAAELRDLECERLDALLLGLWQRAAAGDEKTARVAIQISKRRSELLGLDRRPRPEPEGEVPLVISGRQNLDAKQIATGIDELLARYRAGRLDAEQAHQELALLLGQLKAAELSVLAEKLDRIEAALEGRKASR
jgi:hypothetical protein